MKMSKKPKPFLTIKAQIKKLQSDGLIIDSYSKAELILSNHSYYAFVNGYRDIFLDPNSQKTRYRPGAHFDDLVALYDFNLALRDALFPAVLYAEDKLKSHIIYEFGNAKDSSGRRMHSADDYLDRASYDKKASGAEQLVKELSGLINNAIKHCEEPFCHALESYGYIPLWVTALNMTFGQTSRFYMCLARPIKNAIAARAKVSQGDYQTTLKILSIFRNCCAHNGRVYCFAPRDRLSKAFLESQGALYIAPDINQKFATVLLCLKVLLPSSRFKSVMASIDSAIGELLEKLPMDICKKVFKKMGLTRKAMEYLGVLNVPPVIKKP